jgi:hypothetical protein
MMCVDLTAQGELLASLVGDIEASVKNQAFLAETL